jgi:hypothetical protein
MTKQFAELEAKLQPCLTSRWLTARFGFGLEIGNALVCTGKQPWIRSFT